MQGYLYRLFPPRPSFALDMSADEHAVMTEHIAYWTRHAHAGVAIAFGPVADAERPHGIAVVLAETPSP